VPNPENSASLRWCRATRLTSPYLRSNSVTEVSVWLPLSDNINGNSGNGANNGNASSSGGGNIVFAGSQIYSTPTVACSPPCTLILPFSPLATPLNISVSPFVSSVEVGHTATGTDGLSTFYTTMVSVTITVRAVPDHAHHSKPFADHNNDVQVTRFTLSSDSFSNVVVPSASPGSFSLATSVVLPPYPVVLTDGIGSSTTRDLTLPPLPWFSVGGFPFSGPPLPGQVTAGGLLPPAPPVMTVPTQTSSTTPWARSGAPIPSQIVRAGIPSPPGPLPSQTSSSGWTFSVGTVPSQTTSSGWTFPGGSVSSPCFSITTMTLFTRSSTTLTANGPATITASFPDIFTSFDCVPFSPVFFSNSESRAVLAVF
jgi:hypothetical protein